MQTRVIYLIIALFFICILWKIQKVRGELSNAVRNMNCASLGWNVIPGSKYLIENIK
jgi:hypothetical protein